MTKNRGINISNVNAKMVRVYKLITHNFFTDSENKIFKDKTKNKSTDVCDEIENNTKIRSVPDECLNDKNTIAIFENDICRLALGDKKADMQLIEEIVFLKVYHRGILKQIIDNGCMINNKKFMFFSASTGQQRNQIVVLIDEEFYNQHKRNITCGLDLERINASGGQNAGKYISYNALISSTSVPFENKIDLDKCVVVEGLTTIVDELVKFLDVNTMQLSEDYVHYKGQNGTKGIEIEHTDGAGMFLPDEQPSTFQVRGRYIKGAMFPFDFKKFALEVAHNTVIKDAYGKEHDIVAEDIRYIFTTSQFKNWEYYENWDEYISICKDENIELTVNNWANNPTDKARFSYQFLQTLPYDSDISEIKEHVNGYLNRCKSDLDFALELIDLKFDPDKPKPLAEAISIYPDLVYDDIVLKNIKEKVRDEIRYAKIGKFFIDGTYTYAMPDMYAFCEFLFMNKSNPTGLIPQNQVYCKVFDDKNEINNVCVLRSPHLSGYEYAKRTLIKSDECKRWFNSYDTVVSIHDLITKTLQMDFDGDEVLITPDKAIWNLAEDKPPLYYNMVKADAVSITNDRIFTTLKLAFENCLVGFISNGESRLWNVDSLEEIDDELICIETAYNNYSIDYPKTGVNLDLKEFPNIWDKHLKYVGDQAEGIKPEVKKPHFFIDKERKSKRKPRTFDYFEKSNNSVMNRINKELGRNLQRAFKYENTDNNFDYHMLMNNSTNDDGKLKFKVYPSAKYYDQLIHLLVRLKNKEKRLAQIYEDKDKNDRDCRFALFDYHCINEIKKIFTAKYYNEELAANTLVHIYYNQRCLAGYFPSILWSCYGHIIVKNIHDNLENGYKPKASRRVSYKQAIIGNEHADELINELTNFDPIKINAQEKDYISSLCRYEKATAKSKVIFALLCMYKSLALKSKKDLDKLYIRVYMRKQNKKQKAKKIKIFNFSKLDKIANVSNGMSKKTISNFENDDFVEVKFNKEYNYYEVKFNLLSKVDSIFEVPNIYNCIPEMYDNFELKDAIVKTCVECGKKFLTDSESKEITCSKLCSKIRIERQKRLSYLNNLNNKQTE